MRIWLLPAATKVRGEFINFRPLLDIQMAYSQLLRCHYVMRKIHFELSRIFVKKKHMESASYMFPLKWMPAAPQLYLISI